MPNICIAKLVIKGYKDNVDEFCKILRADYNYGTMEFSHKKHFYRIFEVYDLDEEIHGVEKTKTVEIECAWSVSCCMFDEPMSYYDQCTGMPSYSKLDPYRGLSSINDYSRNIDKEKEMAAWHIIHSTHIMAETRRLGLFIEIVSEEPGMCFQEHYKINQSTLISDETTDFYEFYIGDHDTKKEWEEEYESEIPLTEEEYKKLREEGEEYYVPQYVEIDDNSSIYYPTPVKNVMCKVVDNSKEFVPLYERNKQK